MAAHPGKRQRLRTVPATLTESQLKWLTAEAKKAGVNVQEMLRRVIDELRFWSPRLSRIEGRLCTLEERAVLKPAGGDQEEPDLEAPVRESREGGGS